MQHDPQIKDYEPVTRSGAAEVRSEESFGSEFDKGSSSRELSIAKPGQIDELMVSEGARERQEKKTLLKRGHALTFAGLFMFTFVIYFRPQEHYPFFLKYIAFWLALFTLIIYVPTQLGLEGRLSVKQREVSCMIFLAIAGLISIPGSLETAWAWATWLDYLKVIVMFIVMINVVRTEKRLRALILLAVIASCVMSAAAINDYRLGRLVDSGRRIEGVIGGLFSNANDLALHLVTMVPIAIGLFLGARGVLRKVLFLACAILFISGVVATFSRGGFLGLVCALSVLGWKLARRNRALLGAVGLALVLLLMVIGPGGYKDRVTSSSDPSAVARTDELKRSAFLMLRHPLFGVGINNFVFWSNSSHASHNAYTQVGAELGIPAMIVYIIFLITPLRRLSELRRTTMTQRRGRHYYLSVGLETSIISFMVSSFFLSVAYLWYAYYLVGYAIALRRLSNEPRELPLAESNGQRTVRARSVILDPHP
jgi:putative inorganic carbon (hco3(-)) transporter